MDMQVWLCDSEERKELKDEREREKRREIVIKILVSSHAPCLVYVRLGIKENRNSKKKKKRKIK